MTNAEAKICIIHENDEWLIPLRHLISVNH